MSAMPPPPPPSGPPPGGASPYGYQPYGVGRPGEHPQGTTILVLGILSLVVCGVLGPFAWSMGNTALREMDANPQISYTNRGSVTAGRICGIIGTVLLALGLVFVAIAILAAAAGTN
jgi:hypothetical protein